MRLAFSTLACPGWSLERCLELGTENGYDGVELRLIDGELIDTPPAPGLRQRVETAFASSDLAVAAVDSSIQVAAEMDATSLVEQIVSLLHLAAAWRAPALRVFGGHLPTDPGQRQARLAFAAGVLDRAADRAEELGVRIGVETHDDFMASTTVAELLRLVDRPGVGAVWDSHHPVRAGESADDTFANIGARTVLAQVKDAVRDPDDPSGWRLVPLGEGEVPVPRMVELLVQHGYAGWLSVEWEKRWHPELDGPEVAIPQHAVLLRRWLAEAEAAVTPGGGKT